MVMEVSSSKRATNIRTIDRNLWSVVSYGICILDRLSFSSFRLHG